MFCVLQKFNQVDADSHIYRQNFVKINLCEEKMTEKSAIEIHLDRRLGTEDERALGKLRAQWLVYDVEVSNGKTGSDIKLFHSPRAKDSLLKELGNLFPNQKFGQYH
jgi:hypothetical protein